MNILHGTWIPDEPDPDEFVQEGCFCLWVETTEAVEQDLARHPQQLPQVALADFLVAQLGFKPPIQAEIYPQYFLLPTLSPAASAVSRASALPGNRAP